MGLLKVHFLAVTHDEKHLFAFSIQGFFGNTRKERNHSETGIPIICYPTEESVTSGYITCNCTVKFS